MKSAASTPRATVRRRGGIKVHDVLFVLFKHKWKILSLMLLGFGVSGWLIYRALVTPSYETQVKLLVRYVLERSAVDPYESKIDASGTRGMSVMDAEIEIIQSSDLALEVVEKIGPEKLLSKEKQSPTPGEAARQLMLNLEVIAARGSNVIRISYRNRDPAIAVAVLNQLVDSYFSKHLEIHRSTGAFENVARQTDQARSRLSQTEDELSKFNNRTGVMSLAESRTALESRRGSVRSNLMSAQVELAQQQVKVSSLEATMGVLPVPRAAADMTNKIGELASDPATPEHMEMVRAAQEFGDLSEQLTLFKNRRNQLMMSRKPGDRMIAALDQQIAVIQRRGNDLIERNPHLVGQARVIAAPTQPTPGADLNSERAHLAALEAKVGMLTEQAEKIDAEVEELSSIGIELTNLERRRQLEEEKYRYFLTSLEKAKVDEALDPTSMPNIGVVQKPSAPVRSIEDSTMKLAIGSAFAGLLSGLVFAFVTEWVIDRRVSRPTEIQARLQLPLMLSIPSIRSKDRITNLIGNASGHELLAVPESDNVLVDGNDHFIAPYAGAIRDRIMFSFELNNITHKPKLIALTGLSAGAGTSTIAAGLARAFAESGNHKILLVDLNPPARGTIVPEYAQESLGYVLERSRSDHFRQSPRNLYLASAPTLRNGKGATLLASAAIHQMIPDLEACDFDYIVFDMPPVGPTSPTLAIAGFMDKVLLVLDAENTNRESLSWSFAELEKGRADVSCIFNKAKAHAPRWVVGDLC